MLDCSEQEKYMIYAYPAVFTVEEDNILVDIPDLPGAHTFGNSWANALYMAQDAIEMWLYDAENKSEPVPIASDPSTIATRYNASNKYISMVPANTDEYRKQVDTRAVKKTLSIPAWLNYKAEAANAPFSQILQQGLKEYLDVATHSAA
jgi:predicted RNase H-like HicB family nuclease